jgi:16S rRNA processing protein RimM
LSKRAVFKIVGAHGVAGEVKCLAYADKEDLGKLAAHAAEKWDIVYVADVPYALKGIRVHKGRALLKLEGVDSKEAAHALIGKEVFVDRTLFPALSEGEYYVSDLVGMDVVAQGRTVGTVTNVFSTGSNDVCEVRGPHGDTLIPLIEDVVVKVDVENRKLFIKPIEGLL